MEKYEEVQDIASGNFGVVRLMRHRKSRELVAVKFIERGEKIDKNVAGEVANHLQLRHPNVIQLKEVMLTQTHLALVLEYAAGGELFDQICDRGPFSESKARFFFQQLISGVSYFHQKHICHRDLKLENVLLDDSLSPRLKICDFGYSKSGILHSRPKSAVGTPAYVAPEVLSRKEYDGKLADIWSCGVILYVMLVGTYPFEDERDPTNIKSTVQRIRAVQYKMPDRIRISADCKQLISRIFVRDPSKRITTKEIKSHPWFLKDLPKELTDSAQSVYERDNTFLDPSTKKILKIVEEARTKPKSSLFKEKAEADEPKEEESEDLELDMALLRI